VTITKDCKGVFLVKLQGKFLLEIFITELQDPCNTCEFGVIVVERLGALEQICKVLLCLLFLQRVVEYIRKKLEHVLSSIEFMIPKLGPYIIIGSSTSKTTHPVYISILYVKQVYVSIELSFDVYFPFFKLNLNLSSLLILITYKLLRVVEFLALCLSLTRSYRS
jgi:hypothetical protein